MSTEMNEEQIHTLSKILHDFGQLYKTYLEEHCLEEDSLNKVGFYATLREMVVADPLPDTLVHIELVEQLDKIKNAAIDDHLMFVDLLFEEQKESRSLWT